MSLSPPSVVQANGTVNGIEDDLTAGTQSSIFLRAVGDQVQMKMDIKEHISQFYVPFFLFQYVIHDTKDRSCDDILGENGQFATRFVDEMTSPSNNRLRGKHIVLTMSLEEKRAYFKQLWRMALEMKTGGIRDALVKKKTAVYNSMGTKFKSKFLLNILF